MKNLYVWGLGTLLSFASVSLAFDDRGLVENPGAKNEAVIVEALHGLPGGTQDTDHLQQMTSDPAYKFNNTVLREGQATGDAILSQLTQAASQVDPNGTLLFYFGGHGGNQFIWAEDRYVYATELKAAIQKGRGTLGPLARLVMIFDVCDAGSDIDPILNRGFAPAIDTARSLVDVFGNQRDTAYYSKLIAMASSQSNELSYAGSQGHMFTVAMYSAFTQTLQANETLGDFANLTTQNLDASHAVFKFVPDSLTQEKMVP